jgi:hypothetical protein
MRFLEKVAVCISIHSIGAGHPDIMFALESPIAQA